MATNRHIIIVESPNKVSHIQKYVGNDYIVTASFGHITKINDSGKGRIGIDWEDDFKADYVIDDAKIKVVKELKDILKGNGGTVYLATDDDAEGEAISWHLRDQLKIPEERIKRAIFKEITPKGVAKGLEEAGKINENKASAALTRGKLDKLLGYKLSPITQKKVGGKSAGRVQSPALRLVVEREREIDAHIPEEIFEIYKDMNVNGSVFEKLPYIGTGDVNIVGKALEMKSKEQVEEIVKDCEGKPSVVTSLEVKKSSSSPKPPFITSSLTRECSTVLSMKAKDVMSYAQKLFEKGLITYMRTDSTRLSEEFIEDAKNNFIIPSYGADILSGTVAEGKKKKDEDKNVQDAHEAIRPTSVKNIPGDEMTFQYKLEAGEVSVYNLIFRRTMGALMKPAQYETDFVVYKVNDKHTFISKERRTVFPGYTAIYIPEGYEADDANKPKFNVGDVFNDVKVYSSSKWTKPKARLNEASLIATLEELNIGRPSTYVSIVSRITDDSRGYTKTENGAIKPTDLGKNVIKFLEDNFDGLTNYDYTAKMEALLDGILNGKSTELEVLNEFYNDLATSIEESAGAESLKAEPTETGEDCPKCGRPLVEREGRYGKFVSCSGFPRCKWSPEKPKKEEVPYDGPSLPCPKCKGTIIKKYSPKKEAYFYACNNFPKCKESMNEKTFEEKFISASNNPLADN